MGQKEEARRERNKALATLPRENIWAFSMPFPIFFRFGMICAVKKSAALHNAPL